MDKKIVVPEGMIKAAVVAYNTETAAHGYKYVVDRYIVYATLKEALRWLSENPIEPTEKQWQAITTDPSMWGGTDRQTHIRFVAEWQRRMFLAPEPNPVVARVKRAFEGCTQLTHEEADDLIREINLNTRP